MSLEIERKFLVANEGWKTAVIRSVRIRDGVIANNKGHKARVRIANDVATIALKSRRRGPVRTEFEYAVPYSDAVARNSRFLTGSGQRIRIRVAIHHATRISQWPPGPQFC